MLLLATLLPLTLASGVPFEDGGSRAKTTLHVETLLEEGRGAEALALYLEELLPSDRSPNWQARKFARAGFAGAAARILERAEDLDLRAYEVANIRQVWGELAVQEGDPERGLEEWSLAGTHAAHEQRAWLFEHLGRSEEAIETLHVYYADGRLREARLELLALHSSRGRAEAAASYLDPRPGPRESSILSGGCGLRMMSERRRRATQRASLWLCLGRIESAQSVEHSGLDPAWLHGSLDATRVAVALRLLQLDPQGLPALAEHEQPYLDVAVTDETPTAWDTLVGRACPVPGQSPSSGLRLVALARLLEHDDAEEFARMRLNGPDDLHALALLAIERADGVLALLERRIRDAFLDREATRREELYRIVTLHGKPEAYALLRALAEDADADLAREIHRAMWRDPPWKRTSWRPDFLPRTR